jgi:hypothetical protein
MYNASFEHRAMALLRWFSNSSPTVTSHLHGGKLVGKYKQNILFLTDLVSDE